jgi:hypothetical protein
MKTKRLFLKGISLLSIISIIPYKLFTNNNFSKKIIKKKFLKTWVLKSDDI